MVFLGGGCSKLLIISLKIPPLFTNLLPLVCYTELAQLLFIYLLDKKYLDKMIYRLPLMQVGWGGSCFRQLLDLSLLAVICTE